MKRLWPYLTAAVVILGWGWWTATPVWGQNTDVVLQFTPATPAVAVGETIDVAVAVENVTDLYGFDIAVGFDPALVEVVDLDPDLDGIQVALGLFLDPGFVIFNQANNELGQLRLVMTQLNPSTPKSGGGNLLVVRFRALQTGVSPLVVVNGHLAQPDGTTFFPETVAGELSVTAADPDPVQPTPSPIPSQLAGTPLPTMTPTATATPRPQVTTTATPPAATTQPTATATRAAATAVPDSPSPTASPPAATGPTVTPTAVGGTVAPDTDVGAPDTGTVSAPPPPDEAALAAVEEAGAATAVPAEATRALTVIGSDAVPAENDSASETAGQPTNAGQVAGMPVLLLGIGLLLTISMLFFFLSRKRQAGI